MGANTAAESGRLLPRPTFARLARRIWNAMLEASRETDPLGAQLLVSCRFWHMPPSPMEFEYITRATSDCAARIRARR